MSKMTPAEEAVAALYRAEFLISRALKCSAPVPHNPPKAPERFKPGVQRVPPTPRGNGPRKVWSVT